MSTYSSSRITSSHTVSALFFSILRRIKNAKFGKSQKIPEIDVVFLLLSRSFTRFLSVVIRNRYNEKLLEILDFPAVSGTYAILTLRRNGAHRPLPLHFAKTRREGGAGRGNGNSWRFDPGPRISGTKR